MKNLEDDFKRFVFRCTLGVHLKVIIGLQPLRCIDEARLLMTGPKIIRDLQIPEVLRGLEMKRISPHIKPVQPIEKGKTIVQS